MRDIDKNAIVAANDAEKLEDFIRQHERLIIITASRTASKYISKNDDEWALALEAFADAVRHYDYDKGSFIPFAELLIKRKLIDYYRVQRKHKAEIQVEQIEAEAIVEYNDPGLTMEIEAITQVFKEYGFTFMDLADCSPKAIKTKTACAKAVAFIIKNPIVFKGIQESKKIPATLLEKNANVPRKISERHRKYIIAAAEILHGDYPCLSEYVSYIKEEIRDESHGSGE